MKIGSKTKKLAGSVCLSSLKASKSSNSHVLKAVQNLQCS